MMHYSGCSFGLPLSCQGLEEEKEETLFAQYLIQYKYTDRGTVADYRRRLTPISAGHPLELKQLTISSVP